MLGAFLGRLLCTLDPSLWLLSRPFFWLHFFGLIPFFEIFSGLFGCQLSQGGCNQASLGLTFGLHYQNANWAVSIDRFYS